MAAAPISSQTGGGASRRVPAGEPPIHRGLPMRVLRFFSCSFLVLFLCGGLFTLAGCDGGPAPGTMATPVESDQAAKQNQAMKDYYKSKGKKTKSLQ